MSLLMQALKKAERAKQNSVSEDELDKPSEAFDDILAPAPPVKRELSLDSEPKVEFSLEPMAPEAPAADLRPRPSPDPRPLRSDHQPEGWTRDLVPDPSAPAVTIAPAPPPSPEAPTPGPSAAAGKPGGAARASAKAPTSDSAGKPRAAARGRGASTAEPVGMAPERLRLIGLILLLTLLVAGFGVYYWQAVMAPGAGSRLPPVPMPPPEAVAAAGAAQRQVVDPGADPGAEYANLQGDDTGATPDPSSNAPRDDLERRLARTEQDLAAAQQAIQAQASAQRADKLPPVAAQDSGEIRVARASQSATVSPALDGAYRAFNSGDLTSAQQQYETALRQDGNNRDALLGLATLAARGNQVDKAASHYLRLLELDPADSAATAGLIGLRQGDAGNGESQLKAALAANPEAAPLLFSLGNLYAQQGRWSEAQQAYFRAVGAAPDNADYAYNLAISLDRLNQGKLALTYYQSALALGQDKAVGFDRAALRKRMRELGAAAH